MGEGEVGGKVEINYIKNIGEKKSQKEGRGIFK